VNIYLCALGAGLSKKNHFCIYIYKREKKRKEKIQAKDIN
jgi:hypothetical protein